VEWKNSKVFIDLLRKDIKESPEYNPQKLLDKEYEIMLYNFYGRPKYWIQ
jgi:hypothetical protein